MRSEIIKLPIYKLREGHIDQDTLDYYISRSGGDTTEIKLIGDININGRGDILVVKSGLLLAKEGEVIKDFSLVHGVLRFVKRDYEVIL
jgi:hypothetical protein